MEIFSCDQIETDAINNEFWPVSFTGERNAIRQIKDFLDRHAGYHEFLWTPPKGDQGVFRSVDITINPLGSDIFTLSTVFEKVSASVDSTKKKRHWTYSNDNTNA